MSLTAGPAGTRPGCGAEEQARHPVGQRRIARDGRQMILP
jgi:hypothetical protein